MYFDLPKTICEVVEMKIAKIHIKGFRNFNDEEITFQNKNLIIGANDVGKTNLIYSLRLLFDKSISDKDLDLSDSDYNAYSGTDEIMITATITNVVEDCLLSIFVGAVKDETVLIRYTNSKSDTFHFYMGFSEETLSEIPTRQYIKRLNMQCVDTNRDLFSFLSRERTQLLRIAKDKLEDKETKEDEDVTASIQEQLNTINGEINSLHYISEALDRVNQELSDLSIHNEDQMVRFIAGESDAGKLLDKLTLAYLSENQPLVLGGDGRNNQIFLATWIAKQSIQKNIDHVTFFAIEEPEAHLHPHQQRKLSEYIQDHFADQVFITSHSPHIASKFDPKCIVRLYCVNKYTHASCGGCSELLDKVISNFGYRLNSISSEVFFCNGVFLVEGMSEVLFYTALSKALSIDLDKFNINILSVEGVGFKPYIAVCNALNIPWVLRTDNDTFSKPNNKPTLSYYAGITRVIGILKDIYGKNGNSLLDYWDEHKLENDWKYKTPAPDLAIKLNKYIRTHATNYGCYISDVDLETDLAHSPLENVLKKHYKKSRVDSLIKAMQTKKAENMLDFLTENHSNLSQLQNDPVAVPLIVLKAKVEERMHPQNGKDTN